MPTDSSLSHCVRRGGRTLSASPFRARRIRLVRRCDWSLFGRHRGIDPPVSGSSWGRGATIVCLPACATTPASPRNTCSV